jgi:DNA-binding CsgD family transcriptional regulator
VAGPVSSPELIGREQELAALEAVLSSAESGGGSFALLAGESGVGKSRLTQELSVRARSRGMTVLVGECMELAEGELPYAPLVGALRSHLRDSGEEGAKVLVSSAHSELERLLPELATEGPKREQQDGAGAQARLFEQLLTAIANVARQSPLLLVIEDLHWADRSTRDFIAFLVRNARREPIALLLTYRSDELHRRHPAKRFVAELERIGGALRIHLRPFSREELTQQVTAIVGGPPAPELVGGLLERSDGNPFFVEELLAVSGGGAALPASLRDALLLRMEVLPPVSRSLLQVAAVAGRTVDHELLKAVAALNEEELNDGLRTAVDNHLLAHDSASMGYSFRHALLREAVYDDLLPGERRALHISVARALTSKPELTGASAAAAAEIAHHWYAAHELQEALPCSINAGVAAEATRAMAEAIVHYGRALEIWDAVAPEDESELPLSRREVLHRAAEAEHLAGEPERAIGLAQLALELIAERTDPVGAALAHERLGRYVWQAGRDQEALPIYRRAVELMPSQPPSEQRAFVLAAEGQVLMLCAHIAAAEARCAEAIGIAGEVAAPAVEAHALNTMVVVHSERGAFEAAVGAAARAREIATELDLVQEIGRSYVNGSDALDQAGLVEESILLAREGVERVRELGADRGFGDFLRGEISTRLLRLSRWNEAAELLGELMAHSPSGFSEAMCRNHLAQLHAERGDHELATAHHRRASEVLLDASDSQWLADLHKSAATNALWQGQPEEAALAVAECLDAVEQAERLFMTARLYELGARACAELAARSPGDQAECARQLDAAQALLARLDARIVATNSRCPLVLAARTASVAEISRMTGVEEVASWSAAEQSWERLGDRYLAAYARWRGAEASFADGERERAEDLSRQAFSTSSGIGAAPLAEAIAAFALRARLELSALPAGTTSDRAVERLGLTARELEVLRLLANGRTNREIATELVISDKTASVHVSHILSKLGVRNRVEAASLAHSLGVESII